MENDLHKITQPGFEYSSNEYGGYTYKPIAPPENYFEELNELGKQASMAGQAMRDAMQKLERERMLLVRDKLNEKGFKHLATEVPNKCHFPKLVREDLDNGWSRFWAYDGTPEGTFIVAIGPLEYDNDYDFSKLKTESTAFGKTTVTFKWQDKDPDIVTR